MSSQTNRNIATLFCVAMFVITLLIFGIGNYGLFRMARGELNSANFEQLYVLTMIGLAGMMFNLYFIMGLREKK